MLLLSTRKNTHVYLVKSSTITNPYLFPPMLVYVVGVGFINPGSLMDRLPKKGSAQADNAQLMGRPMILNNRPEGRSNHRPEGLAEEKRRPFFDSGPPLRLEHSLRSPSPPSDSLSDRKAWPKALLLTSTHVSDRGYAKTLLTARL